MKELDLFDQPQGKSIHEDSTQSFHEQKARGRTEHFRFTIFTILSHKIEPVTDRELMEILDEDDVNNVRPEVTRLKQDGLIKEVDKVKCPRTGKTVRRTIGFVGAQYFSRPRSKKHVEEEAGDKDE